VFRETVAVQPALADREYWDGLCAQELELVTKSLIRDRLFAHELNPQSSPLLLFETNAVRELLTTIAAEARPCFTSPEILAQVLTTVTAHIVHLYGTAAAKNPKLLTASQEDFAKTLPDVKTLL